MDFTGYSDAELEDLRVQVRAEQEARGRAARSQVQADALVEAVASGRASDPITVTRADGATYTVSVQCADPAGPAEWEPTEAYSAGDEVTYDGRRFEALQDSAGTVPPPDAVGVWQGL